MAKEDGESKQDSQEEGNKSQVDPEVEKEARGQGWVPLEEFRDSEDRWVDAETFVKRGREINPILRKHNAELKRELAAARAEAQEAITAAREFRAFQKEAFERKKQEYEEQIKTLRTAKKQAITDGDGDKAVAIDEAIDQIKETKDNLKPPAVVAPAQPSLDPALVSWIEENNWYGKDTEESIDRTEMTNAMAMAIRRKKPNLVGKDFLAELDREIDAKTDWRKKRERSGSPVEGGGGSRPPSGSTKGKSYSDLPADAKAACDKYVKQKLMTKEEYVKEYFNE